VCYDEFLKAVMCLFFECVELFSVFLEYLDAGFCDSHCWVTFARWSRKSMASSGSWNQRVQPSEVVNRIMLFQPLFFAVLVACPSL
jgi:hypothetical protein